jgi:hypothetical protein
MSAKKQNQYVRIISAIVASAVMGAVIIHAQEATPCWVSQVVPCVKAGDPCSAKYNNKMYSGTVEADGDQVDKCTEGSPGRTECKNDPAEGAQLCTYSCRIVVNGQTVSVPQNYDLGKIKWGGGTC